MAHPLAGPFIAFASRLRFPTLFMVTLGLFLLDLLVPDFIPFIDELLLGLGTLLLSSWKRPGDERPPIDVEPPPKP